MFKPTKAELDRIRNLRTPLEAFWEGIAKAITVLVVIAITGFCVIQIGWIIWFIMKGK